MRFNWSDAETDSPTVVKTGNRCNVIAGPYLARCHVSDAEQGDVTEADGERTVTYSATLKVDSVRKMHWPERVYRRVRFWARSHLTFMRVCSGTSLVSAAVGMFACEIDGNPIAAIWASCVMVWAGLYLLADVVGPL